MRTEVTAMIQALVQIQYGSIRKASIELGIPEKRLARCFREKSLDRLQLGEIKRISPLLRKELKEDVIQMYLP